MFSSCAWSQAVDFSLFITVHSLHPLMLTIREALGWMAHVCNHLKWPQSLTDLRENSRSSSGEKSLSIAHDFLCMRACECEWERWILATPLNFLFISSIIVCYFWVLFFFCCGDFRPKTPFSFFSPNPSLRPRYDISFNLRTARSLNTQPAPLIFFKSQRVQYFFSPLFNICFLLISLFFAVCFF